MTVSASVQGVERLERFRTVVARSLGLHFDETRLGPLAEALERLGGGSAPAVEAYLRRLELHGAGPEDVRVLAKELTVGETFFFRNTNQFRAFCEVSLRERIALNANIRRLRILSAGCASGEEAYSLSIAVRGARVDPAWEVSIVGVDVNPAALEKARLGRYSHWSLRETPPDVERRWFQTIGREYVLDPELRDTVRFEERNLTTDGPVPWPRDHYDVIFCRNVVMYFAPETARAVIARLARSLVPSGYLFLGHAETLRGVSHDFRLCHTHDTFYYQRRDPAAAIGTESMDPTCPVAAETGAPQSSRSVADDLAGWTSTAWVDAVQRSTARIQELSEQTGGLAETIAKATPAGAPPSARDVRGAFELLERERFGDALTLLDGLPADSTRDPDILLLRAALLTHSGQITAAEDACRELRGLDEMSAGAHYLLALCRESVGDRTGAAEEHQVAAYLDPDFAMPRLHLGLLARRTGDGRAAQRELRRALSLLAREDASRILLFGGGFTREALTHLCRTELQAAGGAP